MQAICISSSTLFHVEEKLNAFAFSIEDHIHILSKFLLYNDKILRLILDIDRVFEYNIYKLLRLVENNTKRFFV